MASASVRDRLRDLVAPLAAGLGCDLEDVRVSSAGRRRVVAVVVDRDGGVDADLLAELSRLASDALDKTDALGETPYVLEVGSPGVDRPLVEPRHWRRATGRLVRAPLTAGGEVTGRVLRADEDGLALAVAGAERAFGWAEVGRGRVQVEFGPAGEDAT